MKRWGRGLLWALLVLVVAGAIGLLGLQRWVGSDDFRSRVQSQAERLLGVPVELGRLTVDAWPAPAVAVDELVLRTGAPLTAQRIELRLQLRELLAGRLVVASLVVRGADLPQRGIDALLAAMNAGAGRSQDGAGAGQPTGAAGPPLLLIARRTVLEDVTWRNLRGDATTFGADAELDPQGLPQSLHLAVSAGALQGARVTATRRQAAAAGAADAGAPSWDIRIAHAGGTIEGPMTVRVPQGEETQWSLRGQFETRNLELGALRTGASGPLSGRLRASTRWSAKAASTAGLAQALVSQSTFAVDDAVVRGIDLAKAVQTVGLSRGGQTRLDTLSGQVSTRGSAIVLSNLAASSGALSATGDVSVAASRVLSGRVNVHLAAKVVGKAVGVPLVVGGTLDAPTVTLTRGAMVGAAIGTLVMPGVGTGAGASVGEAIGEKLKGLFGK